MSAITLVDTLDGERMGKNEIPFMVLGIPLVDPVLVLR